MKTITNDAFLSWASNEGIILDQRYHAPETMSFKHNWSLHVPLPGETRKLSSLILGCLEQLPDDETYVWKHGGQWLKESWPDGRPDLRTGVYDLLSRLGLSDGEYTICFASTEKPLLATLLYLLMTIAWKVPDDLFVVSRQADAIFYFDHDEYLHLGCRDAKTFGKLDACIGQCLDPGTLARVARRHSDLSWEGLAVEQWQVLLSSRDEAVKGLDNPAANVRNVSLQILSTRWNEDANVLTRCKELIRQDPDPQVRVRAINYFISYHAKSADGSVTSFLAEIVLTSGTPPLVREAAYLGLLRIHRRSLARDLARKFTRQRFHSQIDLEFVRRLLTDKS